MEQGLKTPSRGRSHKARLNRVGSMILLLALAGAPWASIHPTRPMTININLVGCSTALNLSTTKVKQYLEQMEMMMVIENLFSLRGHSEVTFRDTQLLRNLSMQAREQGE